MKEETLLSLLWYWQPFAFKTNKFLFYVFVYLSSLNLLFLGLKFEQDVEHFRWEYSSVQFSCSVMSDSLQSHGMQHARHPCPSSTPRVYPNSFPLSWWCQATISSSVIPFSSCLQSFPALGSFQMSQLFATGSQSIGVSVSASVLPMNNQDWFPLGFTGWISLQSKGLSRVSSNTTVQKHQFFSAQCTFWSNSHIHIWRLQ